MKLEVNYFNGGSDALKVIEEGIIHVIKCIAEDYLLNQAPQSTIIIVTQ
jgi:hypothetical protein